MDPELTVQRLVQMRIGLACQITAEILWVQRGGLQHLDPEDAEEFSALVGQIERLAGRLMGKAGVSNV